jgi:DNA-binding transcriptional ArsR family regulator
MSRETLTPELVELIAHRFKALSEPARLRLLNALRGGPRTVTELVDDTRLGQTNVSKHLAVLRTVQLVVSQRSGLFVYYAIADARLYTMCDLMCDQLRAESFARQKVVA